MTSNYQDLLAQKLALEKQAAELTEKIETARASERAAVMAQIKALMSEHGVTLAELSGKGGTGGTAGKRAPKAPKATGGSGKKVAAKYRNTATGDSWSGRGLKPNWLKAALASGRKIEEFAV